MGEASGNSYFEDEERCQLLEQQAKALESLASLITQTLASFYKHLDEIDRINLKYASMGDTRIAMQADAMKSSFVPLKGDLTELKGYVGRLTMESLERKSQAGKMRQQLNSQIATKRVGDNGCDFVNGEDNVIGRYRRDERGFKLTAYEGDPRNPISHSRNDLVVDGRNSHLHHHGDRSSSEALHENMVLTGDSQAFPRNSEVSDARQLFGI